MPACLSERQAALSVDQRWFASRHRSAFESADAALREAATRERAERLSARATQTWLRGLSLPPGTRLTLQTRAEAVTPLLESSRTPVTADVEVHGATALRLGDADVPLQRVFDHSGWLRLVPKQLFFDFANVYNVAVNLFRLARERHDATLKTCWPDGVLEQWQVLRDQLWRAHQTATLA